MMMILFVPRGISIISFFILPFISLRAETAFRLKLRSDFLFRESTGLRPQHRRNLIQIHSDLVAQWNETFGKIQIVFLQQFHRQHHVVNIPKYQRAFPSISQLLLDECGRMLSPMTPGVEMMRCMVSVIITVSITLRERKNITVSSTLPKSGCSWV